MDFNRIINGMMRAMRLDKSFFEEIEHDPSYNQDALAVVIIVSLISGVGSFLGALIGSRGIGAAILALIVGVLMAVIGYYVWVFVAHWVGTSFFKGSGDRGEVQRALGFSYAPQVLAILGFIPCVGWLVAFAAWIWSIVCGFVAIRQSLDQDNTNAALTMIVSFIVVLIVTSVLGLIFGALGLGVAGMTGALRGIG
jgi:hypothetical protein